ncbi:fimbrial protein [Pseudomonas sp. NFIX28]|uniref:fimbrial protein n=1 Tax=Pseudomonas sp. NFIX28 TaxID=1566235 RepID=UPI00089A871F|nr:fimbrial protein [Pseudomonas sp. NFIX28]SDY32185.1 Pilin (type 1 fimbria component protein) [Pseudomonas sp. NFIX28]
MKAPQTALLIILLGTTLNAAASDTCPYFNEAGRLNLVLQDSINFPRDVANGTVLLEKVGTLSRTLSITCNGNHKYGIQNQVGGTTSGATTFPIKNTGLSWQIISNNTPLPGHGGTKGRNTYIFNEPPTFRLIKTGNISANAEIPTGVFGGFVVDGVQPLSIYVTTAPKVVTWSCETPDIKVHMGEHDLGIFEENGAYSPATRFDIKLNNCPVGVKKVAYQLVPSPTSPVSNAATGTVELNKNSSEARGIALQILDDQQQPLALNQAYTFNEYSATGGNFSIPLAARFIRTVPTGKYGAHDTGMKAGTANAEVLFVMSYM